MTESHREYLNQLAFNLFFAETEECLATVGGDAFDVDRPLSGLGDVHDILRFADGLVVDVGDDKALGGACLEHLAGADRSHKHAMAQAKLVQSLFRGLP